MRCSMIAKGNHYYCIQPLLICWWKTAKMNSEPTRHVIMGQIPPASTTPGSWTTIVWSINQIQVTIERQWSGKKLPCVNSDLDIGDMTLNRGHETIMWYIIKIQLDIEELWPWQRFCLCVHCDLDLGDMTLGQGHHSLGPLTTIVWNIIQIQLGSEEVSPGHRFAVCMHCDLDIRDMTLGYGHDATLGHGQLVCEILLRSILALRSYGTDMDFWYICTVTLTFEIWPWAKVLIHPWVMDNNCVKHYPDQTWQCRVMARTQILSMCALWSWYKRYDLSSRSWHTLRSWTIIVWNIILIQLGSYELWPRHGFLVCVHCDLDIGEMTLGQDHDTSLGHGQQISEILSRSDKWGKKLWPGNDVKRRTNRRTGWFLCLRGGGEVIRYMYNEKIVCTKKIYMYYRERYHHLLRNTAQHFVNYIVLCKKIRNFQIYL